MIGAAAPLASLPRCGPNASPRSSRSAATTSRSSPDPANRTPLCRLLWQLWSPNWRFDDATFERTAASFDNPDFVEVVIQSYRHRFGLAPGDPSLEAIEERLAAQPPITVPTIVLHGACDGVSPP